MRREVLHAILVITDTAGWPLKYVYEIAKYVVNDMG